MGQADRTCGISPRASRALMSSITAGNSTMVSIR